MIKSRRYQELYRNDPQTAVDDFGKGFSKPGKTRLRKEACELYGHLRTASYHMIGIRNALGRLAADFSALDGSNWRNNRGVSEEIKNIAERMYKTDLTDAHKIIEFENELEAIIKKSSR